MIPALGLVRVSAKPQEPSITQCIHRDLGTLTEDEEKPRKFGRIHKAGGLTKLGRSRGTEEKRGGRSEGFRLAESCASSSVV